MKLIRKIEGFTRDIYLSNGVLFYLDKKEVFNALDLSENRIKWSQGEMGNDSCELADSFMFGNYNIYIENEKTIVKLEGTLINKTDGKIVRVNNLIPKFSFQKDKVFCSFRNEERKKKYCLYNAQNDSIVWVNEHYVSIGAFIKDDYFYTLEDMRLEMIEAMTGKLMLSISTEAEVRSDNNPQTIIDVIDGYLIMIYDYYTICAIDLSNGKLKWKWNVNDEAKNSVSIEFSKDDSFLKVKEGSYYYAAGRRLLKFDIVNRKIEVIVDTEVEIRGRMKKMMFHSLFKFDELICFYGMEYNDGPYSTIGIFDIAKEKVVDFADDEFSNPLRFKPQMYENRLFQQDYNGNIHVFEMELEE